MGCPAPVAKIFLFFRNANQSICAAVPSQREGRHAIVTAAGRDAVDASGALDEGACSRTEKSCGPDAPTLASSLAEVSARRRWQESRSPGRVRRKPLKPL